MTIIFPFPFFYSSSQMYILLQALLLALSASAAVVPRQFSNGTGSCPPNLKAVTFNGGYDVNQFDKIGAADNWITFGLGISGTPTAKGSQGHIPMMAFASDGQYPSYARVIKDILVASRALVSWLALSPRRNLYTISSVLPCPRTVILTFRVL